MYAFDATFRKQPKNYNLSDIATKSGFKFRDIVNRKLDWKTLGCVDVNKIVDNQDYEFLERIVPKLIEAPMHSILSTAALDPAVSSLFRLAQLSLQYLSFCQQFMDHTLFDLRTAFNQSQKKYSNLKHNYKLLEEQHYKAQERIQHLLESNGNNQSIKHNEPIIENHVKPTSLFPCDQCTKNFLTIDSLRSHQQRKHGTFDEKHELSDDNEKEKNSPTEKDIAIDSPKPRTPVEKQSERHINDSQPTTKQDERAVDNNNDVPKKNCTECAKKSKVSSSSVAVQCEREKMHETETDTKQTKPSETNTSEIKNTETAIQVNGSTSSVEISQHSKQEADLVRTAYDTINELKQEILELRNALNSKQIAGTTPSEAPQDVISKDNKFDETNDKIEFMAQKFDAFEAMYTQSQINFVESFRSLDERQKDYMINIQETVKEIVEESIGKYSVPSISKRSNVPETIEDGLNETVKDDRVTNDDLIIDKKSKECTERGNINVTKNPVEIHETRKSNESDSDWTSENEEKHEMVICQADIHTVNSGSDESSLKPMAKTIKKKSRKISTKQMAKNEFEQRLHQLGIDADSVGLSTPRSQEIIEELADEREEMKMAFKSFKTTRHKLETEVDRLAKEKLRSASSVTSRSSASQSSDDLLDGELEDERPRTSKLRPKSANIQKIRKRNAKKIVKKYLENDIDESDIMDKMEMAQKAINTHRECIQELLQTTAHAPNKITRIKYPADAATTANGIGEKPVANRTENDNNSNQYNKMPNITSRRVVFVNLDEDS